MQTVSVRVVPALRSYICSVNNGSDTIFPDRKSRLWGLVKTHLVVVPPDFRPSTVAEDAHTVKIVLYNSHRRNWNHPSRKVLVEDTLWRNYLAETGQNVVADYLMRYFKQTFRSYMAGAIGNNPSLSIKQGILRFCSLYRIDMDVVTYEMLRKDWFRFRQRNPEGYIIPIENKDF